MIMKKCCKCKIEKELVEFSKDKNRKSGLNPVCRKCDGQYTKQHYNPDYYKQRHLNNPDYYKPRYESGKDGLYHVYYLPLYNYVGMTGNIIHRMGVHKNKDNRNTTGYEVWKSFDNKADARYFEALLHAGGYKGKHTGRGYKSKLNGSPTV